MGAASREHGLAAVLPRRPFSVAIDTICNDQA